MYYTISTESVLLESACSSVASHLRGQFVSHSGEVCNLRASMDQSQRCHGKRAFLNQLQLFLIAIDGCASMHLDGYAPSCCAAVSDSLTRFMAFPSGVNGRHGTIFDSLQINAWGIQFPLQLCFKYVVIDAQVRPEEIRETSQKCFRFQFPSISDSQLLPPS